MSLNPLAKCQPHKMVKHTQTICLLLLTNCLSMFDHFVGLIFKGLTKSPFPSHQPAVNDLDIEVLTSS